MTSIVSAVTGKGARDAADAQVNAASSASDIIRQGLAHQLKIAQESLTLQEDALERSLEMTAPYRAAGETAISRYESLLYGVPVEQTESYRAAQGGAGVPISSDERFDPMDFVKETPGYQFRLDEGQKALERSAASRSGVLTGAQLKATERYAQDYATSEYDNALRRIGGVAEIGVGASTGAANNVLRSADAQSNIHSQRINIQGQADASRAGLETDIGAARASGYLGTQRAGENVLNTVASFAGSSFGGGGSAGGFQGSLSGNNAAQNGTNNTQWQNILARN